MKNVLKSALIALSCLIIAGNGVQAQNRIDKSIEKEFRLSGTASLEVNSKFGNVEVLSWDNNYVKATALIWVESSRESNARSLLEKLDVDMSQEGNIIRLNTVLPEKLTTGKDMKFQVDLSIQTPEKSDLNIVSKYGSVYIDENNGHVLLDIQYGKLKAGSLGRGNVKPLNEINLAYSDADIQEAGWIKMDNSYSKANIQEIQTLVLISKYSGLSLEECSSLVTDSKYDTYRIGELKNFNGELKYSNMKIGELDKLFEYTGNYSSVGIEEVGQGFELIKISNLRGDVKLGIDSGASFKFTGTAERGEISVPGLEISSKKVENTTKFIEGKKGNNPVSKIEIYTKEGGVKILID